MSDVTLPTSEESNSQRVLRGFVAMTATSFAVMGVQLGYAAISSRLLPPSAFGAYAVALSGVGFIGMVGGSSLGQAAARRDHDSVHLDRSLLSLALILGCATAMMAILLAPLWGRMWGVPESTPVTRVMALGIPLSGLSAVLAGILRRNGQTSAVAGRTGLGQLAGMAVGIAAILRMGTMWSLAVAPVTGLAVTTVLLSLALPRERLKPAKVDSTSIEDVVYGAKSAGMNLLRYGSNAIPAWSIGRFVGSADLGAYNRAATLLTIPMDTLQRSLSYSLFPELRKNGPATRSESAFTDILILVSWPAILLTGSGVFMAAPVLSFILGPEWLVKPAIPTIAFLLGVIPIVGVPLGSMLEARGHFRPTLLAWAISSGCVVVGAAATWRLGSPTSALLGLLVSSLANTLTYFVACVRMGAVQPILYLTGIRNVMLMQALATGSALSVLALLDDPNPVLTFALGFVMLSAGGLITFLMQQKTTFGRIAQTYRIPGFR